MCLLFNIDRVFVPLLKNPSSIPAFSLTDWLDQRRILISNVRPGSRLRVHEVSLPATFQKGSFLVHLCVLLSFRRGHLFYNLLLLVSVPPVTGPRESQRRSDSVRFFLNAYSKVEAIPRLLVFVFNHHSPDFLTLHLCGLSLSPQKLLFLLLQATFPWPLFSPPHRLS